MEPHAGLGPPNRDRRSHPHYEGRAALHPRPLPTNTYAMFGNGIWYDIWVGTDGDCIMVWSLFILLLRLLLHHTSQGKDVGTRELKNRIRLFDRGAWDVLLESARKQQR